jgi:DNA-binding PadR family transcriptional regulator
LRLKPSSYLILGMLRAGAANGYAVKRAVDLSTRFFWATSFAQIYPELAQLEDAGYIIGRDEPRGARRRKTYRITKEGEHALDDWLRSPRLPTFEFRDEGLLRLFFADGLHQDQAVDLVKRLRQQAEELDRRFREQILPLAESGPEQGLHFPLHAARLGADYYAWRARWLARLEEELLAGTSVPPQPR